MQDFSTSIDRIKLNSLIVNSKYKKVLENHHLDTFDSIFNYKGGVTAKKIKERSVIRIEIEGEHGTQVFYIKLHKRRFIGMKRFFSLIFPKVAVSEGRLEFENICEFRKKNLPTVAPVAAGELYHRYFWIESFLVTEAFFPFVPLEEILETDPGFFMGKSGEKRKRNLIEAISGFAVRMHSAGLNHRDYNATHILLYYQNGSDIPDFSVFDLQSVDKKKILKFRWMIKSLARVNYSLPLDIFNERDRLYLFLSYKGKSRLNFWDKFQWVWFKRKTAKIRKHTEKIKA